MSKCRIKLVAQGIIELMHHGNVEILYFKLIFLDLRVVSEYVIQFIREAIFSDGDTLRVFQRVQLTLGVF